MKIQTRDKKLIDLSDEIVGCMRTICDMVSVCGPAADVEIIPLPTVDAKTMYKVIEWIGQHKGDPDTQPETTSATVGSVDVYMSMLSDWDLHYLNQLKQDELIDIVMASNYLNVKGLLDMTCKYIAFKIKGKTTDELREYFNIFNDFSPNELDSLRVQGDW